MIKDALTRTNEVLAHYNKEELPVLENAVGDNLIKPAYRKKMKKEFQDAFIADLNDILDDEIAEAILTADGICIVASNEYEGSYTIQIDVKFKNLDYDAYDEINAPKR